MHGEWVGNKNIENSLGSVNDSSYTILLSFYHSGVLEPHAPNTYQSKLVQIQYPPKEITRLEKSAYFLFEETV